MCRETGRAVTESTLGRVGREPPRGAPTASLALPRALSGRPRHRDRQARGRAFACPRTRAPARRTASSAASWSRSGSASRSGSRSWDECIAWTATPRVPWPSPSTPRPGRAHRPLPRPPHRAALSGPGGGLPDQDEGSIEAPMADEWEGGRRRVARGDEASSPALTRYRVRERFPGGALLEVELQTGRQHQIRVHLAHGGLAGPRRSGLPQGPNARPAHPDPAARCCTRKPSPSTIPVTGQRVSVTCPLPVDFRATLLGLRRRARAGPRKSR